MPPVTKRQQGEMIYDALDIPKEKRTFVSIPLGIFDILISAFMNLEMVSTIFNMAGLKGKFEDAAEVTRIVRYYASEPMVALGEGEVQGRTKLRYIIYFFFSPSLFLVCRFFDSSLPLFCVLFPMPSLSYRY